MTREQPKRLSNAVDAPGEDILAWLARAPGAAFVISPHDAMLLATNAAGAKALGFETEFDGTVPLDSAMPAIMDLRRVCSRGSDGDLSKPASFVFWTPDGVARLLCRVRVAGEPGPRRLALVAVEPSVHLSDFDTVDQPAAAPAMTKAPASASAAAAATAASTPAPPLPPPPEHHQAADIPELPTAAPPRPHAPKSPPVERTSPRTLATAAALPPAVSAAPLAPPQPPPPRSDDETLKAIARQILAGRKALTPPGADRQHAQQHYDTHQQQPIATPPVRQQHISATADEKATASAPAAAEAAAPPTMQQPSRKSADAQPIPHKTGKRDVVAPSPAAPAPPPASSPAPPATAPAVRVEPATSHDASNDPAAAERRNLLRRIAHELKTPVSAIASAAEIMKDERFGAIGDARYLRYARDIHASAHHALDVIERMLGRRVFEGGNEPELAFTDVDINVLVRTVVSSLEILAIEAGISLKTELAPKLARVVADATSVRQILLNALTNALKFSPRGGVVMITSRAQANGPLSIEIADNGPGIPIEEIARIAAQSADGDGHARRSGGFGIGLPLAHRLATANGAALTIENVKTGGTRISLVFPNDRQIPV